MIIKSWRKMFQCFQNNNWKVMIRIAMLNKMIIKYKMSGPSNGISKSTKANRTKLMRNLDGEK